MSYIFFEGTQAGIIKISPVIKEFERRGIPFRFICSGQHGTFGIIKQLIERFGLPEPEYLCKWKGFVASIPSVVVWVSIKMLPNLIRKNPKNAVMIVQGDSMTTLVGALWAKLFRCKLVHIEAGMRSFNFFNPFPEEFVRVFVDKLADVIFASSETAYQNLSRYHSKKKVVNMGANTLMDTVKLSLRIGYDSFSIPKKPYAVVTLHRYETISNQKRFRKAMRIIELVASRIRTLFFMHETMRRRIVKYGRVRNFEAYPFLEYPNFINLVANSEFVVTDSGGLQEECYYLGKPCLVLRDVTEHKEGIGENICLCGFSYMTALRFLDGLNQYVSTPIELSENPSEIIADVLVNGKR